jgi:hypothetical protein
MLMNQKARGGKPWTFALLLGALVVAAHEHSAHALDETLGASPAIPAPEVRPTSSGPMRYRLASGWEQWPEDKRRRVINAMNAAVGLYNELGRFPKEVTAAYSPGTPTADGNYNGNIRFGGQIGFRVALHELGHVLGAGQHPNWGKLSVQGKWEGPQALAQLRAFEGPQAVLHSDRMHFWPYGLNQDSEGSPENFRRHVLMVAAIRRDLGITPAHEPFKGMVGVGTWETQAEFKNIKVTKDDQTLFSSSLLQDPGWKMQRGQWSTVDGALRQTGSDQGARAWIGNPGWSDYTLSLKARKLGGKEGFLIGFGSAGDDTKTWWNLGGYGNTQHLLQAPDIIAPPLEGSIETGRWYDVRLEVAGPNVKCYLDGRLVQEAGR